MRPLGRNPVEQALWFIESRFDGDIALEDIASCAGVSRYHLARAFAMATGHSVMGYVRKRRLTEAARALAAGAPDILAVAIDAGYASHEAFTRAFRDQFGLTPEAARAERQLANLALVEPIRMDKTLTVELPEPRFENAGARLIVGIGARYTFPRTEGIPAQWQRLAPHFGHVTGQVDGATYGVSHNFDDDGHFDYLAGIAVTSFTGVPDDLARLRIAAHRYVVFLHAAHVSALPATHNTIWNVWLPQSGLELAEPLNFERYDRRFDPQTGMGGVEIWIPVKA